MRHQSPLEQKLATACRMSVADLNQSLLSWPSPHGQPCWPGRRTIFHEGRPQTTIRLMIEHVMGRRADSTWRFVRKYCATTGCQNPHHYELQTLRKYDGTPVKQPPPTYFSAELRNGVSPGEHDLPDLPIGDEGPCLDINVEHENDFGDVNGATPAS